MHEATRLSGSARGEAYLSQGRRAVAECIGWVKCYDRTKKLGDDIWGAHPIWCKVCVDLLQHRLGCVTCAGLQIRILRLTPWPNISSLEMPGPRKCSLHAVMPPRPRVNSSGCFGMGIGNAENKCKTVKTPNPDSADPNLKAFFNPEFRPFGVSSRI